MNLDRPPVLRGEGGYFPSLVFLRQGPAVIEGVVKNPAGIPAPESDTHVGLKFVGGANHVGISVMF